MGPQCNCVLILAIGTEPNDMTLFSWELILVRQSRFFEFIYETSSNRVFQCKEET